MTAQTSKSVCQRHPDVSAHISRLTISTDRVVAERSMLIKNMLEDVGDEITQGNPIPIPNVCCLKSLFVLDHL